MVLSNPPLTAIFLFLFCCALSPAIFKRLLFFSPISVLVPWVLFALLFQKLFLTFLSLSLSSLTLSLLFCSHLLYPCWISRIWLFFQKTPRRPYPFQVESVKSFVSSPLYETNGRYKMWVCVAIQSFPFTPQRKLASYICQSCSKCEPYTQSLPIMQQVWALHPIICQSCSKCEPYTQSLPIMQQVRALHPIICQSCSKCEPYTQSLPIMQQVRALHPIICQSCSKCEPYTQWLSIMQQVRALHPIICQ